MSYIVVPHVELCIIAKQGLGCQSQSPGAESAGLAPPYQGPCSHTEID